ncbi:MAG: biotin--[acetyl-CoA-carboxylase] ligase [Sedimentisphaerales bacterium]|nr:biotin--[acetyl-CoA-carboxylase] ligase [Sedimentisphaerales bacterium]
MSTEDRLDPDAIQTNLRTRRIGRKVLVYDRTASTNDVAAEYARNPDHDGLVVFAEEQTTGRGRNGAAWHSRHGDSLLFSVVLIDCKVKSELLPLTAAVAVADAIGQVGGHQARIKWPNDVLLDARKVGGILVESRRAGKHTAHVIGIGINCHQSAETFPPELRETATSLDRTGGIRCHRIPLARRVLTSLDHWLTVADRGSRRVTDAWSRLSTQLHHRVTLSCNGKRFTGHCIGVDPEKGLILQLDRGGVRMFDAAHTHIVKTPPT